MKKAGGCAGKNLIIMRTLKTRLSNFSKEEWLAPLQFIDTEDLISFDELKNGCADTFTDMPR